MKIIRFIPLVLNFIINWLVLFFLVGIFADSLFQAIWVTFAIVGGYLGVAFSPIGEKYTQLILGLRKPDSEEANVLLPVWKDVCERAGIEFHQEIFVADTSEMNALAMGRVWIGSRVVVFVEKDC